MNEDFNNNVLKSLEITRESLTSSFKQDRVGDKNLLECMARTAVISKNLSVIDCIHRQDMCLCDILMVFMEMDKKQ